MDICNIVLESKDSRILTPKDVERIFSFGNEKILFKIVAENEKEPIGKFASIILKNRNNFWENKHSDKIEDFTYDLNNILKKEIKKVKKVKKELFNLMNKYADEGVGKLIDVSDSPNVVFFKLFMQEYNDKYAFTWRAFKEVKRNFEKSHPVEGEDIYILKQLLEKDPNIVKITNSTLFCKSQHTLSDSTIKKIKEKIG